MAHFLCHLGCSHFGALLLDFYFTENTVRYCVAVSAIYKIILKQYIYSIDNRFYFCYVRYIKYKRSNFESRKYRSNWVFCFFTVKTTG